MIPLTTISEGVNRAKLYNISELKKLRSRLVKGEKHCSFRTLLCVNRWIKALTYDIIYDFNDNGTQAIYKLLMQALNGFGGSYIIDPNVNIPGTIIVINGPDRPYEKTLRWFDLVDTSSFGRNEYINPSWKDWNPILSVDNMPYLSINTDYSILVDGGFRLLPGGSIPELYEGQLIRAVGFEPIF